MNFFFVRTDQTNLINISRQHCSFLIILVQIVSANKVFHREFVGETSLDFHCSGLLLWFAAQTN